MTSLSDHITDLLSTLPAKERKETLRDIVARAWPELPAWSSLAAPKIEEVQKASVGSGTLLTFFENGVRYAVLAQAGAHYGARGAGKFTIPGGFAVLPESPRAAASRESGEEVKDDKGNELLTIEPQRLKPMDVDTIAHKNGDVTLVVGLAADLTRREVETVKAHIMRMDDDTAYRDAVIAHSANEISHLPEVAGLTIFKLDDLAAGNVPLLHEDQLTLFRAGKEHYDIVDAQMRPRRTPTRAYREKVRDLPGLVSLVDEWRRAGVRNIGITSGTFDLFHPGHASFLEDANHRCDRLIVVIASDRTTRMGKGPDKPYVTETKRAQTIAAIESVDAVIISDEPYHETILRAIRPGVMFKGDDYAGMKIFGADMVDDVVFIPCAEKAYFSSSEFARRIKAGQPDDAPSWAP